MKEEFYQFSDKELKRVADKSTGRFLFGVCVILAMQLLSGVIAWWIPLALVLFDLAWGFFFVNATISMVINAEMDRRKSVESENRQGLTHATDAAELYERECE